MCAMSSALPHPLVERFLLAESQCRCGRNHTNVELVSEPISVKSIILLRTQGQDQVPFKVNCLDDET